MAQARGYRTKTVIDFETSFKTEPSVKAGKVMPFNSNSVVATQNLNTSKTITGTRNPVQPFKGNVTVDGEITLPNDYRALGYILKAMFGDPVTTEAGSGKYQHIFKLGETQPSLVIEKQFPDIGKYFKYTGCKVSTFSLPFGGDGESVCSVGIIGAVENIGTAAYDASATPVELKRAENFQCHILVDGTEKKSVIREGTLSIDLGLDGDQYFIGDEGTRGDIPESIISASAQMTALFQDTEWIEKAKDGVVGSLAIKFTNGTEELEFKFPEGMYERNSPSIDGKGGILCTANFTAFHSADANNSAIVVTLKNDVATY